MLSQNQTAILLLAMNSAPLGLAVYATDGTGHFGPVAAAAPEPAGPLLKVDSMVVHLQPDNDLDRTERYAHLEFDLEMVREEDRDQLVKQTAQIREAVLGYFLDHTVADLKHAGGLVQTKAELVHRINKLEGPKIRTLYFVQFLIQ
jgi:flagellar basal body-associated protein FliL